jgi:hypothetical protein
MGKSTSGRRASKLTVNVSHKWGSANGENMIVLSRLSTGDYLSAICKAV